jgi:CHAT domain-containing protein
MMVKFYQNRQKMNQAQALRQAMLETMKTHPEPVKWAAFTLIGEAD